MGNLQQQYDTQHGVREGEAPTGQTFKWHFPTSLEYGAASGAVPGLFRAYEKGALSEEAIEKTRLFNRKLLLTCVDYPVLVDDPAKAEIGSDVDWLPVDAVKQADAAWLVDQITKPMREDPETAKRRGAL